MLEQLHPSRVPFSERWVNLYRQHALDHVHYLDVSDSSVFAWQESNGHYDFFYYSTGAIHARMSLQPNSIKRRINGELVRIPKGTSIARLDFLPRLPRFGYNGKVRSNVLAEGMKALQGYFDFLENEYAIHTNIPKPEYLLGNTDNKDLMKLANHLGFSGHFAGFMYNWRKKEDHKLFQYSYKIYGRTDDVKERFKELQSRSIGGVIFRDKLIARAAKQD